MRYNTTYHQQADKLAQEHGYEFAVYMGHFRKSLAFIPYSSEMEAETAGFHYILVSEKQAKYRTFPFPPIGFPLDTDYLKKGRSLFRELEEKVNAHNFDDPDWRYCNELYSAVTVGNWGNPPISKNDLCLYLQAGERLGRKIEIVYVNYRQEDDVIIYETDVNNYYLKLENFSQDLKNSKIYLLLIKSIKITIIFLLFF